MESPGNCCKIVSSTPKTCFGQISPRTIVEGFGPQCLGRGQCGARCNCTNGEG
jgi:hypothetical protein